MSKKKIEQKPCLRCNGTGLDPRDYNSPCKFCAGSFQIASREKVISGNISGSDATEVSQVLSSVIKNLSGLPDSTIEERTESSNQTLVEDNRAQTARKETKGIQLKNAFLLSPVFLWSVRLLGFLTFVISIIWYTAQPGFEPVIAITTGLAAFIASFISGNI